MSIGFIFFIAIIGVIEQRAIIENNSNKSNTNREFCWIILADLLTMRKKNEEKTDI